MQSIRIRQWSKLHFSRVDALMPQLRALQIAVAHSNADAKVRNLETHKLKQYREGWRACVFLVGLERVLGVKGIELALSEDQDYDVVARFRTRDGEHYTPIQIKEYRSNRPDLLPPLEVELEKISKYKDSEDLAVIYLLGVPGRMDLAKLRIPEMNIAELWFFGNITPDQSGWFLYGDVLSNPKLDEFVIDKK